MEVAVVGSGISGLAAAWLLHRRHQVRLFEANPRLGGHTWTHRVQEGNQVLPLDLGFMVFNHRTYPNLTRLFHLLSIPTRPADMSLSVHCHRCGLQFNGSSLRGLAAQPGKLLGPAFWRLVVGILRFHRRGRAALSARQLPAEETLAAAMARWRLDGEPARHYLYPMAAAIWSSGTADITRFPALSLLHFLGNHGLLGVRTHHQWYSVRGGADTYVQALAAPLKGRVHAGVAVAAVERHGGGVHLHFTAGGSQSFDAVVLATHADQALRLLACPTAAERELLGTWRYAVNRLVLHTDTRLLPPRRGTWAAWNVAQQDCVRPGEAVCVTYHLNRLQEIPGRRTYLVTLNPITSPTQAQVLLEAQLRHPIMSAASLATQPHLPRLDGVCRTWFCGAYHGWGFHEDGLNAAIRVAAHLGVSFP